METLSKWLIFIVIGILLSALKSNKQQKVQHEARPQQPRSMAKPHQGSGPGNLPPIPRVAKAPATGPHHTPAKPYLPTSPSQEGVHAVPVPQIVPEDAYAEPHPDVPSSADWRRAIIAHEILKTKF